jgi:DNA-binding winged helix-turn-helix (wHTH) protein
MKSHQHVLRFGEFTLDPLNRVLTRQGTPVDLGGRYFDALALLAGHPGQLISKDRLHEEVWRGVPVTDEALSQAIMALRRTLGDDAANPRFIETVPRHGYRFVAELADKDREPAPAAVRAHGYPTLGLMAGIILGSAMAGALVGLLYGFLFAREGAGSALSLVLVLICVSVLSATVSGLGIGGGIALIGAARHSHWWRPVLGGAIGGLILGGFARLLGLDALRLLVGKAPLQIAGAGEGLAIGLAVGTGLWIARRARGRLAIALAAPAALGALTGLAVVALGGTLMAGSLMALVASFPAAGLSTAAVPHEAWLLASGVFEGAVFVGLTVAAAQWWQRPDRP